ncbi:MAG: zinc-finger domain-containing protein [Alphaproteobacteria bacterium]|nr:MAG: zinc-finger domain-containing protein [Alphaproteobacteria bacterium]
MSRQAIETVIVQSRKLNCDGGDGPLGHPRVFLNMGVHDFIDCPYCSKKYILSPDAAHDGAHH